MTQIDTEIDSALLAAGQRLAEQRTKLKMDVKDCADTLKMSTAKLVAVESGQKNILGSEIFVRGYLRNYAKLLGVSQKEIFYLYDDTYDVDDLGESKKTERVSKKKRSSWWLPYLVGIIVIVLWFTVSETLVSGKGENIDKNELHESESVESPLSSGDHVLSLNIESSTPNEEQLAAEDVVDQPIDELEISFEQVENELTVNENVVEDNNLDGLETVSSGTVQDVESVTDIVENTDLAINGVEFINEEQAISEPQVSLNAQENLAEVVLPPAFSSQENQLHFSFTENCWVEVVDANGVVLVSSLRLADTDLYVTGQGPFNITFGNVNGASLNLDNEPVVLTPERGNRILRITVGS